MTYRISPNRLTSRRIHHEAVMFILHLCANLKILHDAQQPLRADPITLEEWSTHRQDFEKCTEPIVRYSQYGQYPEGEMPKHGDLLLAASLIIGELKLRNAGQGINEITIDQIEELEGMAMQVDCRKQMVFY